MFDHDGASTFGEARRVIRRTVVHDQHELEMLAHRHDQSRDAGRLIETGDHCGIGGRFKHGDSLKLILPRIEAKLSGGSHSGIEVAKKYTVSYTHLTLPTNREV